MTEREMIDTLASLRQHNTWAQLLRMLAVVASDEVCDVDTQHVVDLLELCAVDLENVATQA